MTDNQNLTFSGHPTTFNFTLWNDPSLCTLETCPKDYATLKYVPNMSGNAFYAAFFLIVLFVQAAIGIRKRTWTFMVAMLGGCILEFAGYIGRILMHNNIFNFNNFLVYLICLTIAPCFYTAAIYLNFSRLIILHGPHLAHFKPRTYSIIFITWDIISLALQGAGGGMADTAEDDGSGQTGINIMIAGLASQVASLVVFMALCGDFAWRVSRMKDRDGAAERTYHGLAGMGGNLRWWKGLIAGLLVAVITIFVRSCFRVAELSEGFGGDLANDEVTFMVLEGGMVAVAAVALTVGHPGFVFGRYWKLKRTAEVFSTLPDVEPKPASGREVHGLQASKA